jgi:hypothetical protein
MLKLNLLGTSDPGTSNEFPFQFQPSFFTKPPFRSYFFLSDTLLLITTLSILCFVTISYWPRLHAISVLWLSLVGFCMVAVWVGALRCYLRIHELYRDGAASSVSDGSLLGVAMSSAAGMIQWGLFFAYIMIGGVLMQLDRVLSGR